MGIFLVYKPTGYTPKQVLEIIKNKYDINEKLSFNGRLDPMARGWLKIATGEDCKKQESLISDSKIYETNLILGIGTDTGDDLGLPIIDKDLKLGVHQKGIPFNINEFEQFLKKRKIINTEREQEYPAYSSIQIRHPKHGRNCLWYYAKNNLLSEIEIPKKTIKIYDFKVLDLEIIDSANLLESITERINLLKDNKNSFRQDEILTEWENQLRANEKSQFMKIKIRTHVSSGCYIRKLAEEIGKCFNTLGFALDINRVQFGDNENYIILNI
jgi:tRNA pseudouridine(55) synthase